MVTTNWMITITVKSCSGGLAVTCLAMACLGGVSCPIPMPGIASRGVDCLACWENQSGSLEMKGFSVLFIRKIVEKYFCFGRNNSYAQSHWSQSPKGPSIYEV